MPKSSGKKRQIRIKRVYGHDKEPTEPLSEKGPLPFPFTRGDVLSGLICRFDQNKPHMENVLARLENVQDRMEIPGTEARRLCECFGFLRDIVEEARAFVEDWDNARRAYHRGELSKTPALMGWSRGTRGKAEPVRDILLDYLSMTIDDAIPTGVAVEELVKKYHLTSKNSLVQILKRAKKELSDDTKPNDLLCRLKLPNAWSKV